MKKILLTGANGFFASRFSEFYKNEYEIIALGRQELDITVESQVISSFEQHKPEYVIHTAAIADTAKCESNPEMSHKVNVEGSINIAKGCAYIGTKLVYLSTEQIFNGNIESGPYGEETKPVPNTTYGKHKLEAETKIMEITKDYWILRLTWLFGFPERNKRINASILWNTLRALLEDKVYKVPVYEYRGMTYVYELIENIPRILDIPYGIYHAGSENNETTYNIVKIIMEEMGLSDRMKQVIQKDEEKFKEQARDLRITNRKLKDHGIFFKETKDALCQCINDFNFKVR